MSLLFASFRKGICLKRILCFDDVVISSDFFYCRLFRCRIKESDNNFNRKRLWAFSRQYSSNIIEKGDISFAILSAVAFETNYCHLLSSFPDTEIRIFKLKVTRTEIIGLISFSTVCLALERKAEEFFASPYERNFKPPYKAPFLFTFIYDGNIWHLHPRRENLIIIFLPHFVS